MDKLSRAVAFAETGGCKDGTAVKRLNCHGIMAWKEVPVDCANGKPGCTQTVRYPRYFKSTSESHAAFKAIWKKSYGKFPDLALAKKWTGNDHPDQWLNNVVTFYYGH